MLQLLRKIKARSWFLFEIVHTEPRLTFFFMQLEFIVQQLIDSTIFSSLAYFYITSKSAHLLFTPQMSTNKELVACPVSNLRMAQLS